MKMNKKGFTLVELLAVIVILAVVMLIAVTAVGPLMIRARKSALGTEGIGLVDQAKAAYQAEQLNSNSAIKSNSTVCFDLEWLAKHGYFEKSSTDGYYGSALVEYDSANNKYTYKFWITNGSYAFGAAINGENVTVSTAGIDPNGYSADDASSVTSNSIPGKIFFIISSFSILA